MELEIRHWLDWFGKQIITATDSQITIKDKNLLNEVTKQFKYSDLSENFVKGKTGNKHFTDLAVGGFAVVLLFSLMGNLAEFTWLTAEIYRWIAFPALLVSAMFLILRLLKNEFVWFKDKAGYIAFSIKIDGPKRKQAAQLVEFIKSRISEGSGE